MRSIKVEKNAHFNDNVVVLCWTLIVKSSKKKMRKMADKVVFTRMSNVGDGKRFQSISNVQWMFL